MESEIQSFITLEQDLLINNFKFAIQDLPREELQYRLVKSYEAVIKLDNYYKEIINAKMKEGL